MNRGPLRRLARLEARQDEVFRAVCRSLPDRWLAFIAGEEDPADPVPDDWVLSEIQVRAMLDPLSITNAELRVLRRMSQSNW